MSGGGPGNTGRLTVEIFDIEISQDDPRADRALRMVSLCTRLRLMDNCGQVLRRVDYRARIGAIKAMPVDDCLQRWLEQDPAPDGSPGAGDAPWPPLRRSGEPASPGRLAEAMVTLGLLVWMPSWPVEAMAERRGTPYTRQAVTPAGTRRSWGSEKKASPVLASDARLRWESLEELVTALGPADMAARISDVRYELAVHREQETGGKGTRLSLRGPDGCRVQRRGCV